MSVLITGASSGIGEACAQVYAAAHSPLILLARRSDRLQKLEAQLRKQYGVDIHSFSLDIQDRAAIQNLVESRPELFDQVEILINNAGLARGRDPIQDGKFEDWDAMIDTNIKGLLSMTRAILPRMIRQKRGHIVNIGSVAGHWVYEKGNVYCATKFAVRALTEGMRMDLQGTGIRVTEISPGMVETEFSEVRFGGNREQAKAVYEGRSPLSARDVAETVLWSTQRPPHVNIQEIVIYPTDQSSVHSAGPKR